MQKEFTDDCIFNEAMEQHHYNTYSSTTHSNARRILYLALNRHGQPRKVQIPSTRSLGKLATYTKSLTQTVPHDRVEQLITRIFGPTLIQHTLKQLCETGKSLNEQSKPKPKCNLKKQNQQNSNKKKKAKRKCRPDEVMETDNCTKPNVTNHMPNSNRQAQQNQNRRKNLGPKCTEEDCKKRNLKKNIARQHRDHEKTTDISIVAVSPNQKKQRPNKNGRNKHRTLPTTTTIMPTTTPAPTTIFTFTTTITPISNNGGAPPSTYEEDMYSDDPMVSSSTEFHEDDDWDETSFSPYNQIGGDQISQFVDFGFDDTDDFDSK